MTNQNVYAAIAAVQGELAKEGIGKGRKNQQQGYQFRGIDDVYNALAPLLSKHGLVILPRVMSRSVTERPTQKGGTLFYTVLEVEFDFVSASDGSKHTVRTIGEAMDSADKSSNKAQSAAYKYACIQTFCIPTEGDNDADSTTHDVGAGGNGNGKVPVPKAVNEPTRKLTDDERRRLVSRASEVGVATADALKIINAMGFKSTVDMTIADARLFEEKLEKLAGAKSRAAEAISNGETAEDPWAFLN